MLSQETEHRLARLFFQIAECERTVERSRQDLSSNPNFDVYSIFRIIDSHTTGKIEVSDLKSFLSKLGISVTRTNLSLVIKQYDSNNDEKLSLEEFQCLVLPSEMPELRKELLSRNVYPVPLFVKQTVARHVELEASYQEQLEKLRVSLSNRIDFNPMDAFRTVDVDRLNFINFYEIRDFLRRNGYSICIQDVDGIIRRIDVDCDLKLNYQEFTAGILPSVRNLERNRRKTTPLRNSVSRTSPSKLVYTSPSKSIQSSPNKSLYSSPYY